VQQGFAAFGWLIPWICLLLVLGGLGTGVAAGYRRRRAADCASLAVITSAIWAATAVTALAVLIVVLQPMGSAETAVNVVPFASLTALLSSSVEGSVALRNVMGNVLLFVPVGLCAGLLTQVVRQPRWAAVLGAATFSLALEAAQFLLPVGRAADVDDVILNAAGAAVGIAASVVIGRSIRVRVGPRPSSPS